MGDHVMGNLTTALRTVTVSRKRALQLIGGALAVAVPARLPRSADAGTKPLVFVTATVGGITASSPTNFTWQVTGAMAHPGSNFKLTFNLGIGQPSKLTGDKARAAMVALLKNYAAGTLEGNGQIVPKDRIAVTLI